MADAYKTFLTPKKAAEELGLQARVIQKRIQKGEIPAKKFGRIFLIERKTWELWKARNIVAA